MKLKTIIIAVALLAATSAQTTERYFVLASGAESCGTFIKAQPVQKSVFLIWAYGYITGVNSVAAGDQRLVARVVASTLPWSGLKNTAETMLWISSLMQHLPFGTSSQGEKKNE